jgi:hypothetical protein
MTTPGDPGGQPRENQPAPGGYEPPPLDQAETQFAQIPPGGYEPPPGGYVPPPSEQGQPPSEGYPPPAYQPPYTPPTPPASSGPPAGYPQQSYPPPSYPPQAGYPPQQPGGYPPQLGGYPPQQPGGYPQQQYPAYPSAPYVGGYGSPPKKTNTLAIASLVTSIISAFVTLMCFVGGVGAIAGVAMGFVALSQIKKTGEQGRGLAIGGIAVGAVELVLGVVLVIIGIGVYTFDTTNR